MPHAVVNTCVHSSDTMPHASINVAVGLAGMTASYIGEVKAILTDVVMLSARGYEMHGCNRALMMASNTIKFSSSSTKFKAHPLSRVSTCTKGMTRCWEFLTGTCQAKTRATI